MLFRLFAMLAVLLTGLAAPAPSAWAAGVEDVSRALRLNDLIGIMQQEGTAHGADLEAELFPGGGGARWAAEVAAIYDAARMEQRFVAELAAALTGQEAAQAATVAFFATERGQRVVALEIEARRALLDVAVEDAAKVALEDLRRDDPARVDLITRFATANDLVEQNVTGALNANLAFYRGMAEGGAFEGTMTEADMLSDVWAQESEIRSETEAWLYPFLALAYQPLTDEDLEAYLAFSESPAGQMINQALFAAFDAVFAAISSDLGLAAARMLEGQDI